MARNIVPRSDKGADLGTPEKNWNTVYADSVIANNIQGENLKAIEQSAGDEITLRSLIASAGSSPMSITVYDDIPITDDLIVPENIELNFKRGGKLSVSATKTLTINGPFSAGLYQVFSGDGSVVGLSEAYVQWFGAVSDYSEGAGTNNHTAIESAAASLISGGKLKITGGTGFATESEISIPANIDVIMDVPIYYTGVANETCLKIGQAADTNDASCVLRVAKAVQSDWSSNDCVGIKFYNANQADIHVVSANNFTVGFMAIGDSRGFAYTTTKIGVLAANKYGLLITNNNGGWTNENLWIGGRFSVWSSVNMTLDRYGVKITSEEDYYNNNNVFLKPSFELGGTGLACGIWIDKGIYTHIIDARDEGNDYGVRFSNNSTLNVAEFGYGGSALDESTYADNQVVTSRSRPYQQMKPIFTVNNLVERYMPYDATKAGFYGLTMTYYNSNNIYSAIEDIYVNPGDDFVTITGTARALGVSVDTTKEKVFRLTRACDGDAGGRVVVICFDANGAVLTGTTPRYAVGVASHDFYVDEYAWGAYRTGSDSSNSVLFKVHPDVKSIWVGVGLNARIKGFSLYAMDSARVYPGHDAVREYSVATQPPDRGSFAAGKVVYNATPAIGQPAGWVCVTGGTPGTWAAMANLS